MGVSMTPDVWSQRQMDEEVDKAGENRRLLWRSRKHSTRGLWSADGALQATMKPRLEDLLEHMFQGAGSKGFNCAGGMRLDKGNGQSRHWGLQ